MFSRLLEESDGEETHGEYARTNAKVLAVLVILVIIVELSVEFGKDQITERVSASAQIIVSHIFAELAVVGMVSLVVFMVTTQSDWLENASADIYNEEEEDKLEEMLEEVHYALFGIVIGFWVFGFLLIALLHKLAIQHQTDDLHALDSEKLLSAYEKLSTTILGRILHAPKIQYLALRTRILEVNGLHNNFNYAEYLERRGLKIISEIAEIRMGSWIILLVMFVPTWSAWYFPNYYLKHHAFVIALLGSQMLFLSLFWGLSSWLGWIIYRCTPPHFKVGVGNKEKSVRIKHQPHFLVRCAAKLASLVCSCCRVDMNKDDTLLMKVLHKSEESMTKTKVRIALPRYLYKASAKDNTDIRELISEKYGVSLSSRVIDSLQAIFKEADRDRSGQLDEDEYRDVLKEQFPLADREWSRIRQVFLHLATNDGEVITFVDFVELHVVITTNFLSRICPPSSVKIARRACLFSRLPSGRFFSYFIDLCRVPVKVEGEVERFYELFRMRFRTVLGGSYFVDMTYERVVKAVQCFVLFNVCAFGTILEFAMVQYSREYYSKVLLVIFVVLVMFGIILFVLILLYDLLPNMVNVFSIEENADRRLIEEIELVDRKRRTALALRVCAMIEYQGQLEKGNGISKDVSADDLAKVSSIQLAKWERDAIRAFNAFDKDGSGGLSVNELEDKLAVFAGGGVFLSREIVQRCFQLNNEVETVVTLPMFLQFLVNAQMAEARSSKSSTIDHFLFDLLDNRNGTKKGKISMGRMQKVLRDINPDIHEHDINELLLAADEDRTGWITFRDLQRMCQRYGHFPTLFGDQDLEIDDSLGNTGYEMVSISSVEAADYAKSLSSMLAWETNERFDIALLDHRGYLRRTLFTKDESGQVSPAPKPITYAAGGKILSWVNTALKESAKKEKEFNLSNLLRLGYGAMPESLSALTSDAFKHECTKDMFTRSTAVQLVFKDNTVIEFVCQSVEQCNMIIHGLPVMLRKPELAIVTPTPDLSKEVIETEMSEAHDMALSAIKDDDAKLLEKALGKGLDVNVLTEDGRTLYDLSLDKNHVNCIEVLRARGAMSADTMINEAAEISEESSRISKTDVYLKALAMIDKEVNYRAHMGDRCRHVSMSLSDTKRGASISVNERVIEFYSGTSDVRRDFERVLDEIAELLNVSRRVFEDWKIPPLKVWVEGHTNGALPATTHDETWHVHASHERARVVVAELANRGVNTDDLFERGCGCQNPIYKKDQSGKWTPLAPLNSRIDFVFEIPNSWSRLLPLRMKGEAAQRVAKLSNEVGADISDWRTEDEDVLQLEGRAGDIDEGGRPAVQFDLVAPNLCLLQHQTTKAAGGRGNYSKGFYMLGLPNADLANPIKTAGGTASKDNDVPNESVPWSIKYVAGSKRLQQFFGNYVPVRRGQFVKISMWIKCIEKVPAPNKSFGFGHSHPPGCDNAWLTDLENGQWTQVSSSYEADETGLDFLMLQLDGVPNGTELFFAALEFVVQDVQSTEIERVPLAMRTVEHSLSRTSTSSSSSTGKLLHKRVRVVGTTRDDYNDQAGIVLSMKANGRYVVKLKDKRQIALKEDNLQEI